MHGASNRFGFSGSGRRVDWSLRQLGELFWLGPSGCLSRSCVRSDLKISKNLLTFPVLERFGCFGLELSAASKLGESLISLSGSTVDLRFVAGAVICFETFCFSDSAPPVPQPTRSNLRALVGGGVGVVGVSGIDVVG